MWREIKRIIYQHHNFLLTTHVNPDGDGIGAAAALTELLILMGKKVRFVTDGEIPAKFSFLNYHQTYETYNPLNNYKEVEVFIVLDTHKKERIGRVADLLENQNLITICIDHHEPVRDCPGITYPSRLRQSPGVERSKRLKYSNMGSFSIVQPRELSRNLDGQVIPGQSLNTFTNYLAINPNACSVGAMIYTLYKECGFELDLQAASGIYASIICDTGRFSYSSTNRKAHKIADECIKLGVDPDLMHSRLFQHVSLQQIRILVDALNGMETCLDNKVVIQTLSLKNCEKMGIDLNEIENADLDFIHDFNKLIEDVQCVVLLRELPNSNVRVSLRSAPNLDVRSIMEKLGGGGHRNAAGVLIKGSIDGIKEEITKYLKELLSC